MRRIVRAGLVLAFSAAFYLLLIDTASLPELCVLIVVALLSVVAFEISREQGFAEAKVRARWLAHAWRPFARAPRDLAFLCVEAISQLLSPRSARGRFRVVAFKAGESEEDRGRRALAESLGSFAPNTIVLGIDPDRGLLLVHQLRARGGRDELDVLKIG